LFSSRNYFTVNDLLTFELLHKDPERLTLRLGDREIGKTLRQEKTIMRMKEKREHKAVQARGLERKPIVQTEQSLLHYFS